MTKVIGDIEFELRLILGYIMPLANIRKRVVNCPECARVQREDAKYCDECGQSLSRPQYIDQYDPVGKRLVVAGNHNKGMGLFIRELDNKMVLIGERLGGLSHQGGFNMVTGLTDLTKIDSKHMEHIREKIRGINEISMSRAKWGIFALANKTAERKTR